MGEIVLWDAGRVRLETRKYSIEFLNGNSYVDSEGNLVLDGMNIEFAETALAA
jgi:hypothetical protein